MKKRERKLEAKERAAENMQRNRGLNKEDKKVLNEIK